MSFPLSNQNAIMAALGTASILGTELASRLTGAYTPFATVLYEGVGLSIALATQDIGARFFSTAFDHSMNQRSPLPILGAIALWISIGTPILHKTSQFAVQQITGQQISFLKILKLRLLSAGVQTSLAAVGAYIGVQNGWLPPVEEWLSQINPAKIQDHAEPHLNSL